MVSFRHFVVIVILPPSLLYLMALDRRFEMSIWKCFFSMVTSSDAGMSRVIVRFFFVIFSDCTQRVSSIFSRILRVEVLVGAFRLASSMSQSIESPIEYIVEIDSSMISRSGFLLSRSIWRLPETIASGVFSSCPASCIKCDIVSIFSATGSRVRPTAYRPIK